MTKKSRKARAKTRASGGYQRNVTEKPHETTVSKQAIKSTVISSDMPSLAVSQKNQYQYIVPELKRIAIISVGLIIILVILTFVLG